MKILIAVDGSRCTKRMLGFLAAHDEWLNPRHTYTVLHCAAALPHRAAALVGPDQVRALYDDDAEAVLRPIRTFFERRGIEANFMRRTGSPAKVVAAIATRGRYELVILGSHGHGALGGVVMGSVATKVMSLCRTPVLLVR